ncbi:hypothetical protein PRIPAC_80840 [Pristionchus pacificus]|uniref:Uncharacterized protein n=1 Tax=Pristionchus pacificus TaxID=54126 RepID=A0A2A6BWS2_PRIPA|nr:hypothetical protein PRIPAC_80840 [Pristionchus pacificus]|eukprot:PDM70328.1 hypothetical protein PRIPAC_46574 [Pristionchus pacificus]
MAASTRSLSPMESLPRELMWAIIEYATETVFDLRLASSLLKSHVDDYAVQRRIVGLVEKMDMISEVTWMEIKLFVRTCRASLLELRYKLLDHHEELIPEDCENARLSRTFFHRPNYVIAVYREPAKWLQNLPEWIGGKAKIVRIEQIHQTQFPFETHVIALLDQIRTKKLKFTNYVDDDFIHHLLTTHRLAQLEVLSIALRTMTDPKKFLLYLSEHVPAVQIYQILDRAISDTVPYFLGMRDFDWAPTFLEMCSKKLDKLSIVNLGLTDFLPIESSEQLRKRLPYTGKGIWFEASCTNYEQDKKYVENNHQLSVDSRDIFGNFVSVKHTSRIDEKFDNDVDITR